MFYPQWVKLEIAMLSALLALIMIPSREAPLFLDVRCTLGEGPQWFDGGLLWTDIEGKMLLHAKGKDVQKIPMPMRVGGVTIQADGSVLAFGDEGRILHLDPKKGWKQTVWLEKIAGEEGMRFNDGAADPRGRVFFGTYDGQRPGRLYRFDPDGTYRVVASGIGCSNGIDWTPDQKHMYHVDSTAKTIFRYRYDVKTGAISGRENWKVWTGSGVPDGLTVDAKGHVWVAIWGEAMVVELDPKGAEASRVKVTSPCSSCPVFGGPKLQDLYITAAKWGENAPPEAGGVYRLEGAGKGVPEHRSRLKAGAFQRVDSAQD